MDLKCEAAIAEIAAELDHTLAHQAKNKRLYCN